MMIIMIIMIIVIDYSNSAWMMIVIAGVSYFETLAYWAHLRSLRFTSICSPPRRYP